MCRSKHVQQLRSIEIINSTTRLHLVGSFYEIYNFILIVCAFVCVILNIKVNVVVCSNFIPAPCMLSGTRDFRVYYVILGVL